METAVPVAEAQRKAPSDIKVVATFLRSNSGPRVRKGVLNGKRVDYFKGKSAIKALLSPAYKKIKKAPKVENEEEATALLVKMLPHAFFLRTDRPEPASPPPPPGQPKPLQMSPQQSFDSSSYYTWFVDSSPLSTILASSALVLIILVGCMFPLWPPIMRLGVWYLSLGIMGIVGLFFAVAVVRLVIWVGTSLTMKHGIWWFPNLFEDVSVVDSFIPFWAWDKPPTPKKKSKYGNKREDKGKKSSSKSSGLKLAATTGTGAGDGVSPSLTPETTPIPSALTSNAGEKEDASTGAGAGAGAVTSGRESAVGGDEQTVKKRHQTMKAYVEDVTEE